MSSSPTPPENRVPASSMVLLTSVMAFMISFLLVFTFQGGAAWWIIPAAFAAVAVTILTQRYLNRHRPAGPVSRVVPGPGHEAIP